MPSKRMNSCLCLLIILIILIGLWWSGFNFGPSSNLPHELHGQLTGEDATVDSTTFGVGGTDLGIILKHNSEFFFFFGDTFSSDSMTGNWRSNTIAKSTDTDPSNGIALDEWIVDPTTGLAKELISSLKIDNIEMTCIPTTALSLDGIIYVFYMSVKHWSTTTGGVWTCNNASVAISVNNGQNFSKVSNMSWDGESNFVLFSAVQPYDESDEYLYLLSTPSGRFGSCYLSRVSPTDLLNISAYSYFSGLSSSDTPIWSIDPSDAEPVFPSPVGEVSVMWNEYLGKWTAFYLDSAALSIVLRTAENLWGPWSDTITIVAASEYPSLYGAFVHPEYVEDNGEVVYFIMSIFSEYNTFVMSVNVSSLV